MDYLQIEGGHRLEGVVEAGGSKNSGLILMLCSLLTDEPVVLNRLPRLRDVTTMKDLLVSFGGAFEDLGSHKIKLQLSELKSVEADYDLVRTMRASITCLGPLLAREGKAKVSLPGGCAIGNRPVDIHLDGMRQLGAEIHLREGYIFAEVKSSLKGAKIILPFPSVGATENLMMAATLAEGETILKNCALEPEIVDIANMLNKMGAKIKGAGSKEIRISGVHNLCGVEYDVMFDRIETATLLLAGPMTGGSVRVEKCRRNEIGAVCNIFESCGISIKSGDDWVEASAGIDFKPVDIVTEPFPGCPTDVQAQLMAFLCQVPGGSTIDERIFENRFMHVPELSRMGAEIYVKGSKAEICGRKSPFHGVKVMATDLRASASLVLAGLSAKGATTIRRIYHLDRGYEQIETKLAKIGAKIQRLSPGP